MDVLARPANAGAYAAVALTLFIVYKLGKALYNVYLHPLRRFPGPVRRAASRAPWAFQQLRGVQTRRGAELHEKYGPVVRLGPNHLSFTDPQAIRDIYGLRTGGGQQQQRKEEMSKPDVIAHMVRDLPRHIVNAEREEHQQLRRALSHGFSEASMRKQEPAIKHYVDLLVERLREKTQYPSLKGGSGGDPAPLNMSAWYNYTTFDVMGDLVFGESFHCLEDSNYHPWISHVIGTIRDNAFSGFAYAGFRELVVWSYRLGNFSSFANINKSVGRMLQNRLDMEGDRDDLFQGLIKHKKDWHLSHEKLTSNGFVLVVAGSETTATTLSGATYLLLQNPEKLARLTREVRSAFSSAEEITMASVNGLPYLLACLNEALRLYPPVPSGLIRVVPKGGDTIAGHFVPGGTWVEVAQWSSSHSKDNWDDPWAFKPERFMDENGEGTKDKLDALQPFSFGARNCIGRNLAYAEMRLILARVIFEFDMRLADDSRDWIDRQKSYFLWDRVPLNVYVTPVSR